MDKKYKSSNKASLRIKIIFLEDFIFEEEDDFY